MDASAAAVASGGELGGLQLGALKARALALGVGEEVVRLADDMDDPKGTMIELILARGDEVGTAGADVQPAAQPELPTRPVPEAVPPADAGRQASSLSSATPQALPQLEQESPRDGIAWKVKLSGARGLLLADVEAVGSCFTVVTWGGSSVRSSSRPNTVDPVWDETLQIPLPLDRDSDSDLAQSLTTNPYYTVEVFDERSHSGRSQCIGRLMLSLVQLAEHSGAPASWRRLSAPPRLAHQRQPAPGTLFGEIEFSIVLADPQMQSSLVRLYGIDGLLRQQAETVLAAAVQLALPLRSTNHDGDGEEEVTTVEYPRAVEVMEAVLADVRLRMSGYCHSGCILLTSHRLIFADTANREEMGGPDLSMEVPVAAVTVASTWETTFTDFSLASVLLRCSDFRSITLSATTPQSSKCLGGIVDRLQMLQTELGDAPCSLAPSTEELWTAATTTSTTAGATAAASEQLEPEKPKPEPEPESPEHGHPPQRGFRLDMMDEYKHQGVPTEVFRSVANGQALPLCETYPETIMVPAAASSDAVVACAKIWAGARLPVLVYWRRHHEGTQCGLFRCATTQVQRAPRAQGSDAHQELIEAIRDTSRHALAAAAAANSESTADEGPAAQPPQLHQSPRAVKRRAEAAAMYPEAVVESGEIGRLLIVECRSSIAAVGQALADATSTATPILGVEHMLIDMANHHAMRASIDALRQLVHDERDSTTIGGTTARESISPTIGGGGGSGGGGPLLSSAADGSSVGESHATWSQELARTQWLAHLAVLLGGAVRVAWTWLARGNSLLVQCATGRDRSAQLSALIQLLLEPRYRSKTGFATLIQKEFGALGFAFSQRLGTASAPTERSPIFLQFLDAVHQLRKQCPESFEFTDAFLVDLATFSGSEWWSDFLFDDERTRLQQELDKRCPSIWEWMLSPGAKSASGQSYTQPLYSASTGTSVSASASGEGMLPARVGVRHLSFWSALFLRYDADSLCAAEMASPPASRVVALSAAAVSEGVRSSNSGSTETPPTRSLMAGGTAKTIKWHPHAPGRALIEGGVELSALSPELVNDTVLYKFELRVGLTTAGILQTRYSTARTAHQSLSKQGVLDSFEGLEFPKKHRTKKMAANEAARRERCSQLHQYFAVLFSLPEVASDSRVHAALHLDRNTRKGLQAMLTMG